MCDRYEPLCNGSEPTHLGSAQPPECPSAHRERWGEGVLWSYLTYPLGSMAFAVDMIGSGTGA